MIGGISYEEKVEVLEALGTKFVGDTAILYLAFKNTDRESLLNVAIATEALQQLGYEVSFEQIVPRTGVEFYFGRYTRAKTVGMRV